MATLRPIRSFGYVGEVIDAEIQAAERRGELNGFRKSDEDWRGKVDGIRADAVAERDATLMKSGTIQKLTAEAFENGKRQERTDVTLMLYNRANDLSNKSCIDGRVDELRAMASAIRSK
jgi:hypothetical protein